MARGSNTAFGLPRGLRHPQGSVAFSPHSPRASHSSRGSGSFGAPRALTARPMATINEFLLKNALTIRQNPCISPDFCLEWAALIRDLRAGSGIVEHPLSRFFVAAGELS